MAMPRLQLFDVHYDWDEGLWVLIVDGMENGCFARKYGSELEAEEGKANLMKKLAAAPKGNVTHVLMEWEINGPKDALHKA